MALVAEVARQLVLAFRAGLLPKTWSMWYESL